MTIAFARFVGPCWRAVATGGEQAALDGTERPGRYNRAGERTLYMSGSPQAATAAMTRYGAADRTQVALQVAADRLGDLRAPSVDVAPGIDPARLADDWRAPLDRGEEPVSWRVADRARALGATGLIDASRKAPGEWHLVLFRWNLPGGATVRLA